MDCKQDAMIHVTQQSQPTVNNNMQHSLPVLDHSPRPTCISQDDGKYFTPNSEPDGQENEDLDSSEQRDTFYCGDAIMFYPDAPGNNGSLQPSNKKEKKRRSGTTDSRPHRCVTCGVGFKQASHLASHVRTHTGEKPYDCEVCGKTFARLDSVIRHMKTHSAEKEKEREERKKKDASEHPSLSPPIKPSAGPPRFTPILKPMIDTCSEPPAKATRKKKAPKEKGEKVRKRSENSRANMERSYKCDCGMAFKQQCHLKVHRRIHTGEKPFVCEVCAKTFGRKDSAARHRKTHMASDDKPDLFRSDDPEDVPAPSTSDIPEEEMKIEGLDSKPFRCIQCHAAFNQRSHLRNHVRTHSGEKPYKCETCGRSFSRKYSAMRHERTHTGEKKHKCEYCGNLYSQRFHLRDHMRTHTGEKPFNCPVCDKAFARKDLAVRHLKTHTDIGPGLFDLKEDDSEGDES